MRWLRYLNLCLGWLYFLLWSLSFYPQIYTNYRWPTYFFLLASFYVFFLDAAEAPWIQDNADVKFGS
jgi:hypothetical protein